MSVNQKYSILEIFRAYENQAIDCGDRFVLKLDAEDAAQLVESHVASIKRELREALACVRARDEEIRRVETARDRFREDLERARECLNAIRTLLSEKR